MANALGRIISALLPRTPAPPGKRVALSRQPAVIYAIGDIHGCLDLLLELEAQIAADAAQFCGDGWLVSLGDMIDRGPGSAQVIDHLMQPAPAGLKRLNLMGNHEAMMLDFLRRPRGDSNWFGNGGAAALASYGVQRTRLLGIDNRGAAQLVESHIPAEHIAFLRDLPVMLDTPAAVFAHAGVRPGVPLAAQSDDDLLWFRDEYRNDYAEFEKPVVHGHTPRETPLVSPYRIAIDTAAVLTGALTAVRITPAGPPMLFATPRRAMIRQAAS